MINDKSTNTARLATLSELETNILPHFITPVPSRDALRNMFDGANIPRFKSNPSARRGGGFCYYSVAAIEKLFRTHTLPPILS